MPPTSLTRHAPAAFFLPRYRVPRGLRKPMPDIGRGPDTLRRQPWQGWVIRPAPGRKDWCSFRNTHRPRSTSELWVVVVAAG